MSMMDAVRGPWPEDEREFLRQSRQVLETGIDESGGRTDFGDEAGRLEHALDLIERLLADPFVGEIRTEEDVHRAQALIERMLEGVPEHERRDAAAKVRGTFAYQQAVVVDSIAALGRAMSDTPLARLLRRRR